MKKFKKILLLSSAFISGLSPIAMTVSCADVAPFNYGSYGIFKLSRIDKNFINDPSMHKNVMSSYFNATDMLAALGCYPDYATLNRGASEGQQTLYPNYLRGILGINNIVSSTKPGVEQSTGKYNIRNAVKVMNGKSVDRESIAVSNISTLLMNEWEKVDENMFTDIVPALIYTSMADGHARFQNEDYGSDVYPSWGFNVFKAFEMQASGLGAGYPGHSFLSVAKSINAQVQANISKAADALKSYVQHKTNHRKKLMVLESSINTGGDITFFGRTPGVYNVLYSKKPNEGLGFAMPSPDNKSNLNVSDFAYKARDGVSFTTEFKGKADDIIILNDQSHPANEVKDIKDHGVTAAKSMLSVASQQDASSHIKVVNRSDFYDSIWGIIGTNSFLDSISKMRMFNKDPLHPIYPSYTLNNIIAFSDTRILHKLR